MPATRTDPSTVTVGFHDELQALLLAKDAEQARAGLLDSCRRRPVAGLCTFRYPLDDAAQWQVRVDWARDLSGELDGLDVAEVAQQGFDATPAWLSRWGLGRRRPFHLRALSRFIPFSTALILRHSAPPGRRRLNDLVVVPFHRGPAGIGALFGLHEPLDAKHTDELVLLASACLARLPIPESDVPPKLGPRQIECLEWIVAGKSLEDTAALTGMSYSTVRYHLDRARERTGFKSLQQLAAFAAVEYGLSPLGPREDPTEPTADPDQPSVAG